MVAHLLPPGLRGIVVAGLLSALMGSLAGVFNACSTLFTVDIYEKLRPKASQHELVRMGRIATAVMVVIAMLWIPVVKGATGLYEYLQSVQGYLAPPIFVVFFFGVFWKRLNAAGCLWAMIVGFVIGIFRMCGGHARDHGRDQRLSRRLVSVDHQQHQLPIFQHSDHDRFSHRDGRRQLPDCRAGRRENQEPHLRHHDRRKTAPKPGPVGVRSKSSRPLSLSPPFSAPTFILPVKPEYFHGTRSRRTTVSSGSLEFIENWAGW